MIEERKHIKFVPAPPKPKTLVWFVINKYSEEQLGWVAWFSRWRKYAFYPKPETVYEEDCLRDIAEFCEAKTKEHKNISDNNNLNCNVCGWQRTYTTIAASNGELFRTYNCFKCNKELARTKINNG